MMRPIQSEIVFYRRRQENSAFSFRNIGSIDLVWAVAQWKTKSAHGAPNQIAEATRVVGVSSVQEMREPSCGSSQN
jgi:hypothetical protein